MMQGIEVQVVLKSALLKGVCHRNVSNNCINVKRSVFKLNVTILGHTHRLLSPVSFDT